MNGWDIPLTIECDPGALIALIYCDEKGLYKYPDGSTLLFDPPPTENERNAARALLRLLQKRERPLSSIKDAR